MISKIGVFLYRRLGTQSVEKYSPNPSKIEPKLSKKRYQKKAQRKNAESWKTNNPPSFLLYFYCQLDSKIKEQIIQNRRKSNFKLRCALEHYFLRIFVDFGANLGSQIKPESRKNQVEKQVDFKKKRGWSMARKMGTPPWRQTITRPIFLKNKESCPRSDTPWAKGPANYYFVMSFFVGKFLNKVLVLSWIARSYDIIWYRMISYGIIWYHMIPYVII